MQNSDSSESMVTISCSYHSETLIKGLWNFFQLNRGVDFNLEVCGQSVRAHQLLVDIFLSPDKNITTEERHNNLPVSDTSIYGTLPDEATSRKRTVNFLLKFLYTGKVTLLKEDLTELTSVARELGFQMLLDAIDTATEVKTISRSVADKCHHAGNASCLIYLPEITTSGDDDDAGSVFEDLDSDDLAQLASEWEVSSSDSEPGHNSRKRKRAIIHKQMRRDQQEPFDDPAIGDNKEQEVDPSRQILRLPCAACDRPECPYAADWLDSTDDDEPNPTDSPEPTPALVVPQPLLRCPHCSHETYNRTTHKHHIYSVHRLRANGQPLGHIFRCSVTECGFECVNASQLKTHHLVKHSGLKPHRCQQCRYASNWKSALNTHIRVVHLRLRPFQCESCGLRLFSQSSLVRHQRTHTGERPFVCNVCGKTFGHPSHFRTHVRLHFTGNERPHICEVCGRAFSRASNLRVHQKIHYK